MVDNLDDLRHIEGFPLGEDEDLLALSDPPHYTAYPNPHLAEFVEKWGTPYDEATDDYQRKPYVADVSEGKTGAVYRAHAYHTKVPYQAIVHFVEHYTQSGDIIFDGFCGTGMTGIAAQTSGRHAILCDLSPAATFIAYNYNTSVDAAAFEREAMRILKEVEAECGWMYETRHRDGRKGRINYVVWSDVFLCPYCHSVMVFWNAAVDKDAGKVLNKFPCPSCNAQVTKRDLTRVIERVYDRALACEIERSPQVPVIINYSVGRQRYNKRPEDDDLALIHRIEEGEIPYRYPIEEVPTGYNTEQPRRSHGVTHIHHFFTARNLWILAAMFDRVNRIADLRTGNALRFFLTAAMRYLSRLSKLGTAYYFRGGGGAINAGIGGTLYLPSFSAENNALRTLRTRLPKLKKVFGSLPVSDDSLLTTQSATEQPHIPDNSVSYIFTDPPFGDNLMYSELNFLWEAWLRVFTNNTQEAIMNRAQNKDLDDYRRLMTSCFAENYRILKPGRWITVVFHNSKSSVWNAIQDALARAGFLVAQVTVMDKKQGSFKQVTAPGAVKNDLIINAYKPREVFTHSFLSKAGQGLEAEFVRQHLAQLPVAANVERSKEMLYSKYLAYYVQHGYQVAYNAEQFYRALPQWGLIERDGYWFADETQANEYESRKTKYTKRGTGQAVLFISDERSARQWLWDFLATPKTYDEIYTAFVKALQTSEDELPEPMTMLEEGFVQANGYWKRPDALTQAELEAKRQARLLRQFEEYLVTARAGRRLKEVRKEALVAGFTEAYRASRFQDILTVGRKLPKRLLESSPDLFDFVDIAEAKVEG